jgi:hypothetical protein
VSQKLDHLEIRRFIARRYRARGLGDVIKAIQGIVRTDAADPNVIKLARQITSGTVDFVADPRTGDQTAVVKAWGRYYRAPDSICRTRDDACELEALWDFSVLNFRYVFDPPHVDTYPDCRFMLEASGDDCDGATVLICSLAMSIGFDVACRIISQDGSQWQHIYPLIGLPKTGASHYFPMDITEPGREMGWEFESPAARIDYRL